ncbi:MAG: TM2 domain-containing protein [Bacteroidales bacterium]|nr:TM2 domain-containing protein [Bacteroidales bacterium]
MKKILAVAVAIFAFVAVASAANYSVDESSIDALFTEAVAEASTSASASASAGMDAQTRNIVALVVDMLGPGALGIHRLILGTNPINCLWYFLTVGGIFGIIPLVDWIMILLDLVNGSASYLDNPAFIMWL